MPRPRHSYDLADEGNEPSTFFQAQSAKTSNQGTLGPDGKPCRTCTDFRSWMKKAGSSASSNQGRPLSISEEQAAYIERDLKGCPQDKDELGRSTWKFLHTMSVNYPEKPSIQEQKDMVNFLGLFGKFYPCAPCAEDFRKDLEQNPPKVESDMALSRWLCQAHNRVNIKVGKPEFDCSKVLERWRDGWKDGSCD
ncbi:hypothetical protein TCAL_12623 [Tigriopus californicus]|uniref:Sulfhydryl oxidase n=1 Tax=Tigriopus californicus TaxID=6832 RepID=A0A553PN29_TIGCA|nr:FAD-linked sulfhydryl oxidase ALR-like [Tigriopus californicus]TRY79087.1 hypothetical protein TCAL_12623 [Tigriopus californicus]|eukprot:TCALIF_12623-PA protein Name:"Similar to Gfer FAD-linked sulfhydryl oxidase ALR (Mus musculus)" AED:0.02 eAED:0.02 QI:96/1/1/1/1/1/2/77/193